MSRSVAARRIKLVVESAERNPNDGQNSVVKQFTPDYWHAKAEEARAQAKEMRDPDARSTMLQIAMIYNAMALRSVAIGLVAEGCQGGVLSTAARTNPRSVKVARLILCTVTKPAPMRASRASPWHSLASPLPPAKASHRWLAPCSSTFSQLLRNRRPRGCYRATRATVPSSAVPT
jgi:hypothetical protein